MTTPAVTDGQATPLLCLLCQGEVETFYNVHNGYSVQCVPCDLRGPRKATKYGAEAAWNRRATPKPPAAPEGQATVAVRRDDLEVLMMWCQGRFAETLGQRFAFDRLSDVLSATTKPPADGRAIVPEKHNETCPVVAHLTAKPPADALEVDAPAAMTERLIDAAVYYETAEGIYRDGARKELFDARSAIETAWSTMAQRVAALEKERDRARRERDELEQARGAWVPGVKCGECGGYGEDNQARRCPSCAGTGEVWMAWKDRAEKAERELTGALNTIAAMRDWQTRVLAKMKKAGISLSEEDV